MLKTKTNKDNIYNNTIIVMYTYILDNIMDSNNNNHHNNYTYTYTHIRNNYLQIEDRSM